MIIEIKQRCLLICYLATLLFPMVSCSSEASPRKQRVCIQQMSGFPNEESGFSLGVSACYAGIIGDRLIIAGGCNFPGKPVSEGGEKRFYQGIYSAKITSDTTLVWSQVGELPFPAAYGVSISHSGKLFIIGGNNSERSFSSVFSISLTDSGKAVLDTLPSLPVTLDNMAGAILIAALVYYSGLLDYTSGALGAFTIKVAYGKCTITPFKAICSGILCNILVCIAVLMATAARDIAGKVWAIFFPICAFVVGGWEHCVANMIYIPAGIIAATNDTYVAKAEELYGITAAQISASVNVGGFISNLIPVTIGNILGGMVFVALPLYVIHKKKAKAI